MPPSASPAPSTGSAPPKRTVLPEPRRTPRFAGLCTFGRYPQLSELAPENSPPDWIVYGVPYDGGVTYRPGARFGPRAVRDESQYLKRFHIEHGIDLCDTLSIADAGDAPIQPFNGKANVDGVIEHALGLSRAGGVSPGARLLAIGGDHSIAFANLHATWERLGRPRGGLPLLHFDSHLDTVDQTFGEKWSHASPFIRAAESGLVDPRRMLSVGIKGPLNAATDLDFARQNGVSIITGNDWRSDRAPAEARIRAFVAALADEPCYLTFDIDCVDPAFAPGTGTPSVGGFSSAEALDLVRLCVGANVAGADVVEVLPDRDHAGITALLAAHVIFEILCLDAVRRRTQRHALAGTTP